MKFKETKLKDVYIIDIEPIEDSRGYFATCWVKNEFEQRGLSSNFVQCNLSLSKIKGTVRGMHFQHAPHQESKLLTCLRGNLLDVVLDLRKDSPTYLQWEGIELSHNNHRWVYLPEGCAHGFQTLEDNSEIFYQLTAAYHPPSQAGVRWNDPAFNIQWPLPVSVVSEKDQGFADWIK